MKINLKLPTYSFESLAEQFNSYEESLTKKSPPTNISKKRYNLPEAANYCKMTESTFRTCINKRKFVGLKPNRTWIFLEEDLDQFIINRNRPTINELRSEAFNQLYRKEAQ